MCRALTLALLLAWAGGPTIPWARAQSGTDRRAAVRLARAESLLAALDRGDSLARYQRYRELLARRFDAGNITVVLANSVGDATGRRVAAGASASLADLGAIPSQFVAARVVVAYAATGKDSVLRAEGLARRVRIMADASTKPDTLADGAIVAAVIGQAYRETLDPEWKAWLPYDLALGWTLGREGAVAARQLMAGETRAGARCLEGDVAQCRLWLGLDRDPYPFRTRYQPAEVRRFLQGQFPWLNVGSAGPCRAGSDDACVGLAERNNWLSPIPANPMPRGTLVREVRALHGAEALRRALADTAGSVGARLARATGISEDSLVAEWRAWLLTGGGNPRVAAGAGDALPAAVVVGLLLFAAVRSGRWR